MLFKKLISTVDNLDFFNVILVILIVFLAYFTYLFFKKKVYQDLQKFLYHIKIVIYTLFIIFCILSLTTKRIVIEIREGDKYSSIIWTIIIALLMGIYLSTSFGAIGLSRKWLKFTSIAFFAYLSFCGFGYLGFRIIFNLPKEVLILLGAYWRNNIFQSNTPRGLYFYADNSPLLGIIFVLTFPLEGEKREK